MGYLGDRLASSFDVNLNLTFVLLTCSEVLTCTDVVLKHVCYQCHPWFGRDRDPPKVLGECTFIFG